MTDEEDVAAPLQAAEAATMDERVWLSRAELMSGILVGIGGEHDVVPTQEQLDRAVDMIFRYAKRRDATSVAPSEASQE